MFFDTDAGGVMHNLAYLRMIETCRTKLAVQLGFDLREMAQTQIFAVLVETRINYHLPARLGDVLEVHGHLAEVERARFWCEFTMCPEGGGRNYVSCRQALALVQMPQGRPVRLPAEIRAAGASRG